MQVVGTAAAFSPAVTPSPARRRAVDSGRRFSRSCRSGRVSVSAVGYSQLEVRRVSYRPPGTEQNLLNEISLNLKEKSFGLLFGRSGSGKTTLLQLLAGLSEPTHGTICIQKYNDSGNPMGPPELLTAQRVGIVFQFPERYFLADTVLEEITFGWPRQNTDFLFREKLALKLQNAINSVGLNGISLEEDPQSLSGGFKRRLALAIQLVQTPDLLLLDEPLAGLVAVIIVDSQVLLRKYYITVAYIKTFPSISDWKARADVVNLLKDLKKDHTILAVSHDLRELYPLVDRSWRMEMGGVLKEEALSVLRISGASKCKQNFNGEIIDFSPNSHRWNEETMSDADFCLGKGKMPVCQVAEFQLQNCISHSSGTGFCKKMQGSHKNLYNLECRAKQH
ncbi:ABC transporter I family member 11, chloroplastic isoform X1 [Oryza sativa Japonica Group]|uniref:ABC transporter I family member 11, chloroplastic isoform X1 n=1 Tax=Oryza sativa subsp. japonica TaxID=39947 RepID=UPI000775390F|nr:ABC transporter I family member 11, chloroplastic isoform X1 [Oryza sativa Japonica Group]